VLLKSNLDIQQTHLCRVGFVEHLSWTQETEQSVNKIISVTSMNLVTPKVGGKYELLFDKPASDWSLK
jgi:hypothetical protein